MNMNVFKTSIAAGQPQIGFWQALASPYTAEICAGAGFDWLLIDAEHAPNDLPLILSQLQAVAPYDVEAVVRAPIGDAVLIKQLLDVGARSLLIPMVESEEQAREIVRATRYPPAGIRGIGSAIGRASRWNRTANYLQEAEQEICLLLQVESVAGLEAIDDIANTPGVDGVFIGPSDLSAALGHIGNPAHAAVQQAIEQGIGRILKAGKAAGILIADETLARRYLSLGATFVAVGTDVTVLARGAEALARRFAPEAGTQTPLSSSTQVY
jgi:4-hydroxy-2-oxoheptanedioate aldolase